MLCLLTLPDGSLAPYGKATPKEEIIVPDGTRHAGVQHRNRGPPRQRRRRRDGRAGDLLERRRILIAGLPVFVLASLAGGLATGQAWLIAARAVQGVGAGMAAPTALSLIAVTFPEERARR